MLTFSLRGAFHFSFELLKHFTYKAAVAIAIELENFYFTFLSHRHSLSLSYTHTLNAAAQSSIIYFCLKELLHEYRYFIAGFCASQQ
jgi:hypothetical protein